MCEICGGIRNTYINASLRVITAEKMYACIPDIPRPTHSHTHTLE